MARSTMLMSVSPNEALELPSASVLDQEDEAEGHEQHRRRSRELEQLEAAGLAVGDVILAVDGLEIGGADALGYRLATAGIGKTVSLTVLRGDERRTLELPLQPAPEIPPRVI